MLEKLKEIYKEQKILTIIDRLTSDSSLDKKVCDLLIIDIESSDLSSIDYDLKLLIRDVLIATDNTLSAIKNNTLAYSNIRLTEIPSLLDYVGVLMPRIKSVRDEDKFIISGKDLIYYYSNRSKESVDAKICSIHIRYVNPLIDRITGLLDKRSLKKYISLNFEDFRIAELSSSMPEISNSFTKLIRDILDSMCHSICYTSFDSSAILKTLRYLWLLKFIVKKKSNLVNTGGTDYLSSYIDIYLKTTLTKELYTEIRSLSEDFIDIDYIDFLYNTTYHKDVVQHINNCTALYLCRTYNRNPLNLPNYNSGWFANSNDLSLLDIISLWVNRDKSKTLKLNIDEYNKLEIGNSESLVNYDNNSELFEVLPLSREDLLIYKNKGDIEMTYTDWSTMKRLFQEIEDFDYFINQPEDIKNRVTTLLPIAVKEYKEVPYDYRKSFELLLEGVVNTLRILDGSLENPLDIKITTLPDRLNFAGCFSNELNTKYNSYGFTVALAITDAIEYFNSGFIQKLYCAVLNPNIARVCKMLYGDEVNDPSAVIQYGWFRGHLGDNHTAVYAKNMGKDFEESDLSEDETKSAGDWLASDLHRDIETSVSAVAPYIATEYTDLRNLISMYTLSNTVKYIEYNKNKIFGYEYTTEADLSLELNNKDILDKFIESNLTSFSRTLINKYMKEIDINYKLLHSLCFWYTGKASIPNRIEAILLRGIPETKFKKEFGLDRPYNLMYLVMKYDLDHKQLFATIRASLTHEAVVSNVKHEKLRDIDSYNHNYLNYKTNDLYTLYPLDIVTNEMGTRILDITKVLYAERILTKTTGELFLINNFIRENADYAQKSESNISIMNYFKYCRDNKQEVAVRDQKKYRVLAGVIISDRVVSTAEINKLVKNGEILRYDTALVNIKDLLSSNIEAENILELDIHADASSYICKAALGVQLYIDKIYPDVLIQNAAANKIKDKYKSLASSEVKALL